MSILYTNPGTLYAIEADGTITVTNASGVIVYTGKNALTFPAVGTTYTIVPDTATFRPLI